MRARLGKSTPSAFGLVLLVAFGVDVIASEPTPEKQPNRTRFASTVQLALQEPNAQQMKRAQTLVIREFENNVQIVPALRDARMSIQKSGNEVVFSLLMDDDLRAPMRQAMMRMIQSLNGRVRARGRTSFYRTSFNHPPQAEFFLTVHDPEKRTVYIEAEQAPLIDLLQEMRRQIQGFSYIIPQECAQRRVYWTFGSPDPKQHPPHLELKAAMKGIAEMLQIKLENMNGAFVFSGDCRATSQSGATLEGRGRDPEWGWPAEILPMRWPSVPRVPENRVPDNRIPEKRVPENSLRPRQRTISPVVAEDAAVAVAYPRRAPPLLQSDVPVQVYFPVTPIEFEH
jgi:hypothetical protein